MKSRKMWLYLALVAVFTMSLVLVGCGANGDTNNNGGAENEGSSDGNDNGNNQVAVGGDTNFSIATAGTGGALYPMGVAMGEAISQNSDYVVNGQASDGSVANIRNLMEKRIGWIIAQNEVAYFAHQGIDEYEGNEFKEIRSLFGTVSGWTQIFVPADSDIKSIADFKGKRIGVGAPGSGGETTSRRVLNSYGLTFDDITPERISDGEMVDALRDGVIDGFISTHPLGSAPLLDLVSSMDVKMLPVDSPDFFEEYPYYTPGEVPNGTYEGVDSVLTATSKVFMYTRVDTYTEDQVYELLSIIFEHRDDWVDAHAALSVISIENALDGIAIPLHPGAVKYFEEQGLDIPEDMK
jgi:TRAP transporter TAXI family solute receptor